MLNDSALIQLEEELAEAREVAECHAQKETYHKRLRQYWQERAYKLEQQLPGLVEAEQVARVRWEAGRG